ncbi:AraC family transcriptional regulator [Vibrio sp. TH_r3]|uniref:helix-turn-helix transcriptional regulator n=1 Tax=Vibrio sp. TH_r3 TaxID=3082084 RepID=UPI002954BFE7|nr:AraC family transcriptional regulator [Vibrio sp. TH_r3]MDV7105149.1 AraC family transcriptional regulator [Vibrio sp. TH_r3]
MFFRDLISSVLIERTSSSNIFFASDIHTPPAFSYQVNFPRLELVINGEYINEMENHDRKISKVVACKGDAIFIPPNCWNKPDWNCDRDCSVLSMLFGRSQLGLSFVSRRKGENNFHDIRKHSIQIRSGFVINNILDALSSLAKEKNKQPMDDLLLQAVLQQSKAILNTPIEEPTHDRVKDLYHGICIYIQENFHSPLHRDCIARKFCISSNHLSRLFRQQGHMTLAEYITRVRVDRAKFILKKYNFKLSEVSTRCGFKDVNYFCRVFKNNTGRTPTEYRHVN